MTRFWEIGRTANFWPKMAIFTKMNQKSPNGIFGQNLKMSHPSHWEVPTLSRKSENYYERILRSLPNAHTDAHTDERRLNHKSQPRCGGPKRGNFWVQIPPPWGTKENFLAHRTEAKSLRATISNICAKFIKIWCAVLKWYKLKSAISKPF